MGIGQRVERKLRPDARVTPVEPLLSFRLVRIEVGRKQGEESDSSWTVWMADDEDPDAVIIGHVQQRTTKGFGQAQALAIITGRSLANQPREEFELWVREHVLEQLYDTARRAIAGQAATMDLHLDILSLIHI